MSVDETSRETALAFSPETGRQTEESTVGLLCGNPDYLLMCSSLSSKHHSTLCNPHLTTFNLSAPPVQLSYHSQEGEKKRKIKKTRGQWLRSHSMSSGHLTQQMWGSPSIHMGDLNSHQHERIHTVLCWQIPLGWLRTQPLMTEECRQTGAMILQLYC